MPGMPHPGTGQPLHQELTSYREREGIPVQHRVAKELLASFVAHLNRHQAHRMAREQAEYLWQQQYDR